MTNDKFNTLPKGALKELLKGIAKSITEDAEPETEKVTVGRVSFETVDRVRAIDEEHDRQHDEIHEKIDAYKEKIAAEAAKKMSVFIDEMEREHKPDCLKHSREMAAVWTEIQDELKIPEAERAINYKLNAVTGEVSKEIPITQDQESETILN